MTIEKDKVGQLTNTETGEVMSPQEAQALHEKLVSGEMKIEIAPEVAEGMKQLGLSIDDLREMLTISARKSLS